jgi:hypothetical protein
MTIYLYETVRCPVYRPLPRAGQRVGCGSARITRHGRTGPLAYECLACGIGFGPGYIEYDREVRADARLAAVHDAHIAGGCYTSDLPY